MVTHFQEVSASANRTLEEEGERGGVLLSVNNINNESSLLCDVYSSGSALAVQLPLNADTLIGRPTPVGFNRLEATSCEP